MWRSSIPSSWTDDTNGAHSVWSRHNEPTPFAPQLCIFPYTQVHLPCLDMLPFFMALSLFTSPPCMPGRKGDGMYAAAAASCTARFVAATPKVPDPDTPQCYPSTLPCKSPCFPVPIFLTRLLALFGARFLAISF